MSAELALNKAFGTVPPGINAELLYVLEKLHVHAGAAGVYDERRANQLMPNPTTLVLHLKHIRQFIYPRCHVDAAPAPAPVVPDAAARLANLHTAVQAIQPALKLWIDTSASILLPAAARCIEAQQAHELKLDARKVGLCTTAGLAATATMGVKAAMYGGEGRWGPAAFFAGCAAVQLAGVVATEAFNQRHRSRVMSGAKLALGKELEQLGRLLERLLEAEVLEPLAQLEAAPPDRVRVGLRVRISMGVEVMLCVLALLSQGSFDGYGGVPTPGGFLVRWSAWYVLAWGLPACRSPLDVWLAHRLTRHAAAGPLQLSLRWWWAHHLLCGLALPGWLPWLLVL
jgi:hypothetical protein